MLLLIEILENLESHKLLSAVLQDSNYKESDEFKKFLHELTEDKRLAVNELIPILPKIRTKFGSHLVCTDRLALEQASNYQLSKYKASLISDDSVLDLCCGVGGDSLFLSTNTKVIGIDLNEARLHAFKYNHKLLRRNGQVETRLEDVTKLTRLCDTFLLDPDRRHSDKQKHWGMEQLSPSISQINEVVTTQFDGLIKLGPVSDVSTFDFDFSKEFIGSKHSALELCLRVGKYRLNETLTTQLEPFFQESHTESQEQQFQKRILTQEKPNLYIIEPNAISLASHVHLKIAFNHHLSRLNPSIPYYTAEQQIKHPFMTNFKFLEEVTFREKKLLQALNKLNASHIEVKKRGVKQDPNKLQVLLQKKLKQTVKLKVITVFLLPSNSNHQKIRVLLAERVKPIEMDG